MDSSGFWLLRSNILPVGSRGRQCWPSYNPDWSLSAGFTTPESDWRYWIKIFGFAEFKQIFLSYSSFSFGQIFKEIRILNSNNLGILRAVMEEMKIIRNNKLFEINFGNMFAWETRPFLRRFQWEITQSDFFFWLHYLSLQVNILNVKVWQEYFSKLLIFFSSFQATFLPLSLRLCMPTTQGSVDGLSWDTITVRTQIKFRHLGNCLF